MGRVGIMGRRLFATIIGLVLGYFVMDNSASAAWRRHDSSFCMGEYDSTWYYRSHQNGLTATNNYGYDTFYCPYIDDSLIGRAYLTLLNVHVYDGNTGDKVIAKACVQAYGWAGGTCGIQSDTGTNSNTGNATLQPGLSEWTYYTSDWAYVEVHLPYGSKIFGYFVQD